MNYIYIMKRRGHGARLSLALPTFRAARIEAKVFERFSRHRITMSRRRGEGLFQQQIKVGISTNPALRIQQVDGDLFGSGRTEWIQAGPLTLLRVRLFVLWLWLLSWLWLILLYAASVAIVSYLLINDFL